MLSIGTSGDIPGMFVYAKVANLRVIFNSQNMPRLFTSTWGNRIEEVCFSFMAMICF